MTFFRNNAVPISIIIRVLVALFGGFILANLVAILIAYMPVEHPVDGIVAGMMVSFFVYTAVVIFVFSTKSTLSASLYVTSFCLIIFGIISYIDMVAK
ncbi:MAG: hypothetical protein OCD00_15695 [Colwellia sp.]